MYDTYRYRPGPSIRQQAALIIDSGEMCKIIPADDLRIFFRMHDEDHPGGDVKLSEPLANFDDYIPDWESVIGNDPWTIGHPA